MPLINPYVLAGMGMPYFGMMGRRPAMVSGPTAMYGGGGDYEAPSAGVGAGLLNPDFLNQDQLGDNALYPGLRPDYLAAQQMGQGSNLNPVFGEQPPSLPPVVDRSFPEGTYGTPAPSISDRVTGLFSGDYWPALMNAGLGMLAESGWKTMPTSTGEAIGKGGLVGTKTYMDLRKQYTNEAIAKEELAGRKQQREATSELLREKAQDRQRMQNLQAALAQAKTPQEVSNIYKQMFPEEFAKEMIKSQGPQVLKEGEQRFDFDPQSGTFKQTIGVSKESAFEKATGLKSEDPANAKAYKDWIEKVTTHGTPIKVDVGVKSYEEKKNTLLAEDMDKIQKGGLAAATSIARFEALGNQLSQIQTGKFKGTTSSLKAAAKAAGLDITAFGITDDVAPAQASQAIGRALALELRNPSSGAGMPGALSDNDRIFLESMIPSIENDPKAWPQMLDYYKKMKRREMDVARMARRYAASHGGQIDYTFYQEMEDYADKNLLFPKIDPLEQKYGLHPVK